DGIQAGYLHKISKYGRLKGGLLASVAKLDVTGPIPCANINKQCGFILPLSIQPLWFETAKFQYRVNLAEFGVLWDRDYDGALYRYGVSFQPSFHDILGFGIGYNWHWIGDGWKLG